MRHRVFMWGTAFGIIAILTVAAGYLAAQFLFAHGLDQRIEARSAALVEAAKRGGMTAMTDEIRHYEGHGLRTFSYRITARDGRLLSGIANMPSLEPGWHDVPVTDVDDDSSERARVLTTVLPDGKLLSVVADTDYVDAFDGIIVVILSLTVGLTAICAFVGGLHLERVVLGHLAAVNDMAGELARRPDLSRRVPLSDRDDEFDALAATFNAMLDRIEALVADNRRVTGYVAHDLRAPLARLAERLADAQATQGDECQALLAAAEDDIIHILELFDAFLAIGHHRDGATGAHRVDLSACVTDLAESFAVVAEASGRSLEARVAPGVVVEASEPLIGQMIVNLIENAIRHSSPGSAIAVTLAPVGCQAELVVSDEARMPVAAGQPSIEAGRVQLGLKLIRSVAQSHGGTFAIEPTTRGMRACVRLPLVVTA
ncbi:ATP-binding protein [Sphingomonas jinjuensis]